MGWLVITGDGRAGVTVYSSEDEAERVARELAEDSEEEIWVAISDQATNTTRIISFGDGDWNPAPT
jgi:hypothetical protein